MAVRLPASLGQVHCGIDTCNMQLVAMKRVKLDAKAERELHMLTMLSNLSDVPRLRCWPGVFSCSFMFGSQPGAALHLHHGIPILPCVTPAYLPCPRLLCFLCLFSRTH